MIQDLEKLTNAISGKDNSRLSDLGMMTGFHHTGAIENFNSLRNKYAGKAYVYSYGGIIARTALAVIDHNNNVNRPQVSIISYRVGLRCVVLYCRL